MKIIKFIVILLLQNVLLFANKSDIFCDSFDGNLWGFARNNAKYTSGMQMLLEYNYFSIPDVLVMASSSYVPIKMDSSEFFSLTQKELGRRFADCYFNSNECGQIGWGIALGIFNPHKNHYLYWDSNGRDVGILLFEQRKETIVSTSGVPKLIVADINNETIKKYRRKIMEYDPKEGIMKYFYDDAFLRPPSVDFTGRVLIENLDREMLNIRTRKTLANLDEYSLEQAQVYSKIKKIMLGLGRLKSDDSETEIPFTAKNDLGDVVTFYFPSTYSKQGDRKVFDYRYKRLDVLSELENELEDVFIKPIMVFSFAGTANSFFLFKRNYATYYYEGSFVPIIEAVEYKGRYYSDSNEIIWEPYAPRYYNNPPKYITRPENLPWLRWSFFEGGIMESEKIDYDWVLKRRYLKEQSQ